MDEKIELATKKITIKLPIHRLRTKVVKANKLLEKLQEETAILVALWPQQQQQTRKLEKEVEELKKKLQEEESFSREVKRKRWCAVCEMEATYMSATRRFYCSEKCEQAHKKT